MISVENIKRLRYISFEFRDRQDPKTGQRFTDDDNLIECFKMLAEHGALHRIRLGFRGEKPICLNNMTFLWFLGKVKAMEIVLDGEASNARIKRECWQWLKKEMTSF